LPSNGVVIRYRKKERFRYHSEWINLRDAHPNFEFAETIKRQLGNTGTILIWSKHERTALREIAEQMVRYNYRNPLPES
jgi:hypothetical protein